MRESGGSMAEPGWFYAVGEQQVGPVSFAELRELASRGRVGPGDLVWTAGMAEWRPAMTVEGLAPGRGQGEASHATVQSPPLGYHGYGAPAGYYGGPAGPSQQGMAIAGFVLSLTIPLLGLIFSWIALSGMKRTGNPEGRGFAVAGMVISGVLVGLACLWVVAVGTCMGAAMWR
jgi:hypothetical protein